MIMLKRYAYKLILVIIIIGFSITLQGTSTAIAERVTADLLNVRTSHSQSAAIAEKLPINTYVKVISQLNDWSNIEWIDLKTYKIKSGWVASKYLSKSNSHSRYYAPSYRVEPNISLQITNSRLKCTESFSGGFDKCYVYIDVDFYFPNYKTFANNYRSHSGSLNCDATIQYNEISSLSGDYSMFPLKKTLNSYDTVDFYGTHQSETVELSYRFSGFSKVAEVNLKDTSCRFELN